MLNKWLTLGLILTTVPIISLLNQKEVQAHCRIWHPHHCSPEEVGNDVIKTVDRWGLGVTSPYLVPVSGYLEYLYQQGNSKGWQNLPDDFKACYGSQYGINLNEVKYTTNINTVHRQAITVGKQIYFPGNLDLNNSGDQRWMLHELEHVRQYQVTGGVSLFLAKYVSQGIIEVGSRGSINIHDNIQLEKEADAKADRILNSCSKSNGQNPHPANSEESRYNLAVNLYRDILGREPEGGAAEGLASRLANGSTLEKERQIMANSPESRNNLANLYREILGREPENGAVDGLVSRLANGSTLEKERQIALNSEEAQNRHRLPNCASTYNPLPYRVAGTPAYDGRVGRIAFMNNTKIPVTVKLYHPDAPNQAFGSYGISPDSNSYLGDSNVIIGTDWGIQVNDENICIVGLVSDGGSKDGQSNFQTWPDRLR